MNSYFIYFYPQFDKLPPIILIIELQDEIAELDKKLSEVIDESEELKEKVKILETVPGIGKCFKLL
jgi:hypothetical protein